MAEYKNYQTKRLHLRPTAAEDADLVLELLNSPKWLEHIGDRSVRTLEDACNYIAQRMTPQLERLGYGNFTVIRQSDDVKLGLCGLYDREGLDGVDLGFAFLPQFEGKGYASESARKVKQLAFEEFGLSRIEAITTPANVASQRLLEKIGFQHIEMITLPEETTALMRYELKRVP